MARNRQQKKLRSIRTQLVLTVNGVLLLFTAGFLAYDYFHELDDRLREKQTALQEEAKTLLPGVLQLKSLGRETVQAYVDNVCSRMEDADSPRHHIAVEFDGKLIQAHAHHRQSNELVSAMKQASETNRKRIRVSGHDLVVGVQHQDNISVFVSEDVSNTRSHVLADEARRMLGLLLLGLIAAAIVNLALVRLVSRPLIKLVNKVREVGAGNFSSKLGSFGSSELNFIASEINAMSDALEESERERKNRLKKAHEIQQNLLPKNHCDIKGLEIGCLYCPAEEVGGDFFDILDCGDDKWLFCLADATDHGVPAAMSAAMLKTLLLQAHETTNQPDEILARMNERFMRVHPYGNFASIVIVLIDLKKGELSYANAGHDPAWLIFPDDRTTELSATGTLLGIEATEEWPARRMRFSAGCRLVIATDGITETFDENCKLYGRERLLAELLKCKKENSQQTVSRISDTVNDFRGPQAQSDDVTLMLVDFLLDDNQIKHESIASKDEDALYSTVSAEAERTP